MATGMYRTGLPRKSTYSEQGWHVMETSTVSYYIDSWAAAVVVIFEISIQWE